jgi:hypothetical protein
MPAAVAATSFAFALPSLERYEDEDEADNDRWYASYVRQEAEMAIGLQKMSRLSVAVLRATDLDSDRAIRMRNYNVLHERLGQWALFPNAETSFAPMGFPMRVPNADEFVKQLAVARIFAARHWRALPSRPQEFALEHALARELITLPCDYRYSEPDMHRVADEVWKIQRAGSAV